MKNKITITFDSGSNFQQESAIKSLQALLSTWEYFYEDKHKKNMIVINFEENIDKKTK